MQHTKLLAIAAAVACTFGVASRDAQAEGCPDDSAAEGEKKQGKFHIEYINGKPVTVIDTVVSVCGKVPRPSVVYVLTAKNIEYEWESLKQDFMPLILASVKKAPF
ncbi:MAG: hypothetical protein H0T89_27335 [Deltaproteobacteria bacterium]|nr:hypothetical protein [Deltaproteobacteria bacterium]MDQ3297294.1 hypothetical protein [Myxococcota bacterium]